MSDKISEAFAPAAETLQEAKANLIAAQDLFRQFAADARPIVREKTLDHLQVVYVEFERPLPGRVRSAAMSCLVNSKHAFDQVVFAGEKLLNGRRFRGYFPWVNSPADIRPKLIAEKIHPAMHAPIIETCPYFVDKIENEADAKRIMAAIANKKHTEGLTALPSLDGVSGLLTFSGEGPGAILYTGPDAVPGELARFKSGKLEIAQDAIFEPFLNISDARLPQPAPAFRLINSFRAEAVYFLNQAKAAVSAVIT